MAEHTCLEHKRSAEETAERLRAFCSGTAGDRIFARMEVPSRAMREFAAAHSDGPTGFPDVRERLRFVEAWLLEQAELEDDWLPFVYPREFDQGLYGGILGAEIHYMMEASTAAVSSMTYPVLNDLAAVSGLRVDPESPVIRQLDQRLDEYSEAGRNRFGVSPIIVIDAMNFVSEVRGATQSFIDTIDHPEETAALMQFALELNLFLQTRMRGRLDGFMDGGFVQNISWAPGTPVSFSVDAYHMAGRDFYYRWGEPHLQRLLDRFDGGVLHIHSNGRHLLEHVSKLRGLLCIHAADEDWNPRAYDELERRIPQAGDVPLVVACRSGEFERDLDAGRLPGNVRYQVADVPSAGEANRLMEKVRAYRAHVP